MDQYKYKSVEDYMAHMPESGILPLQKMRDTIKKAVPEAEEVISYNMPAYRYKGILVYFALAKNHIGYYPMPSAIKAFALQLKGYKHAKGSVQFPLDKDLPLKLIAEMARFRFEENNK
ncbi:MAG: iron chaperone [Cyclobacteriaceae bacterium]